MQQPFELAAGASAQVFDALAPRSREAGVVYRIYVERFDRAELKIITEGGTRMLTPADTLPMIDVHIGRHLYLQAVGEGTVKGWFALLSASGR